MFAKIVSRVSKYVLFLMIELVKRLVIIIDQGGMNVPTRFAMETQALQDNGLTVKNRDHNPTHSLCKE